MLDMLQLPFNLVKMKRAFSEWQTKLQDRAWNALYIENHFRRHAPAYRHRDRAFLPPGDPDL